MGYEELIQQAVSERLEIDETYELARRATADPAPAMRAAAETRDQAFSDPAYPTPAKFLSRLQSSAATTAATAPSPIPHAPARGRTSHRKKCWR